MAARDLAKERFLLLIDQVMKERNCSERDASKWVGLDYTAAHKVRTEERRSVGADSWDRIKEKIGLRTEWFTSADLGARPRWRDHCGKVTRVERDVSALERYLSKRKAVGMSVPGPVETQAYAIAGRTGVTDASVEALVNFAASLVVDGVLPTAGPNEATTLAPGQVKRARRTSAG